MTEAPLQVEGFGRRYRRTRPWAIRDVSFTIPVGAIVALVGPNGSGKSTLIRACLGFEIPSAGRVLVFGADPQRQRREAVEAIGYIPQSASLYRNLSIRDHFTMAITARPTFDRALASGMIQAAGLGESRKVGELSGGEQAQVALSLALGTRAPLLLLDEPLASLDPLARRDFLTTLSSDVRQRAATAVISSHLIGDVAQLCDWVVVLTDGQLTLASSIAEATGRFHILAGDQIAGNVIVGAFSSPSGDLLRLVDGRGAGRPATLEEIVLGHMAAARTRRSAVTQ